jgi:hypothetical protein
VPGIRTATTIKNASSGGNNNYYSAVKLCDARQST